MKMTKFKVMRLKACMTQTELAEKAGVSWSTIARLEQNPSTIYKMQFQNVAGIAKAIGATPDDMYNWGKEEEV